MIEQMGGHIDEYRHAGCQPELAHYKWIAAVAAKSFKSSYERYSSRKRGVKRRPAAG